MTIFKTNRIRAINTLISDRLHVSEPFRVFTNNMTPARSSRCWLS
jgi:hypothetical protein